MSTVSWQNLDRGPKAPLLTVMLYRLAIPRTDETSTNLKMQIWVQLPFTEGLLSVRH